MALHQILQNTVDSRQDGEVAFMHVYTSNIMPSIRAANASAIDQHLGGTFSLTMEKLLIVACLDGSIQEETAFALERSPHRFTSVVMSSSSSGNRQADAVVVAYAPERAAATAGKLVFHFFAAADANRFRALVAGRR